MTLDDLKSGMVLEFGNKRRALLIDNEFFLITRNSDFSGSRSISCLNKDLQIKGMDKDNGQITKVYKPITPAHTNIGTNLATFMFMDSYLKLLWEHKVVVVEMTLEEVCKQLGKEIKIVK